MPTVKITQEELHETIEAMKRIARRTGTRPVVLWERIELVPPRANQQQEK